MVHDPAHTAELTASSKSPGLDPTRFIHQVEILLSGIPHPQLLFPDGTQQFADQDVTPVLVFSPPLPEPELVSICRDKISLYQHHFRAEQEGLDNHESTILEPFWAEGRHRVLFLPIVGYWHRLVGLASTQTGRRPMDNENLPDRIVAKITIDLDFAREDQPLISEVLQSILDNLGISSSGKGSRTAQSHYSYKLETNQPSVPMTMETLLDIADQSLDPGEPSARERIAETLRPDYDEALEWWEGLAETQRQWIRDNHSEARLVTHAWDIHKSLDTNDRAFFEGLTKPK